MGHLVAEFGIRLVALVLLMPRRQVTLIGGTSCAQAGCVGHLKVATPVGSNAARLGPLMAGLVEARCCGTAGTWGG